MRLHSDPADPFPARGGGRDSPLRWAVGVALAAFVVVITVLLRGMWLAAFA